MTWWAASRQLRQESLNRSRTCNEKNLKRRFSYFRNVSSLGGVAHSCILLAVGPRDRQPASRDQPASKRRRGVGVWRKCEYRCRRSHSDSVTDRRSSVMRIFPLANGSWHSCKCSAVRDASLLCSSEEGILRSSALTKPVNYFTHKIIRHLFVCMWCVMCVCLCWLNVKCELYE